MPCRNVKGELMGATTARPTPPHNGPGTELKHLLTRLRIFAGQGCGCHSMAAQMNANGPAWCREHLGEIVDTMATEAQKRGLPFIRIIASQLVLAAVRKAERQGAQGGKSSSP